MKTSSILLALGALCHHALANPAGVRLARSPSLPDSVLTFTGPAVAGGPDVTLTGTAQSIHEQLLALNPDYYETNSESTTSPSRLAKRADCPECECNPQGSPVPNFLKQCWEGVGYLEKWAGAMCKVDKGSCARVSCSRSCGISLCNDNNYNIEVPCPKLAEDANRIEGFCGNGDLITVQGRSVKGQFFGEFQGNKYNTIVKEDGSCA